MSKDLYFGQKVLTVEGPGKVVKFGYKAGQVDKVEVKLTYRQTISKWFHLGQVWEDKRVSV